METKIKVNQKIDITEEDFKAYERVRASGQTNMFAVGVVCDLSGLEREKVMTIMENYEKLVEEYPEVKN